jgi:hypothetical protein
LERELAASVVAGTRDEYRVRSQRSLLQQVERFGTYGYIGAIAFAIFFAKGWLLLLVLAGVLVPVAALGLIWLHGQITDRAGGPIAFDLERGQVEQRELRVAEAVLVILRGYDDSRARKRLRYGSDLRLYFLRLESDSCLVLEDHQIEDEARHPLRNVPRHVVLETLPRSGHLINLEFSGERIPVMHVEPEIHAVDNLMPGLWRVDELLREISIDPAGPPLFPVDHLRRMS